MSHTHHHPSDLGRKEVDEPYRFLFWMLSFERTVGTGKLKRENFLMVYMVL